MTIKRKTILLSVVLLTVLLVLAALIACDPTADKVDKASQNQEFVSFRKKVVKILKDNGIFVNDLDKTTVTAVDNNGVMYATSDLLYANGDASDKIADVGEIMTKNEYLADDTEGYDFALKQVYSLALKMSLCVGDGLLNYFNESNFYNVPVYIPDVNLVVTSKDNEISIYIYQQTIDNNSSNGSLEFFNKIHIVFNSDDDYYFTVVETGGDWISSGSTNDTYFYGDSKKQFLMFSEGKEVFYTPDATEYYTTGNQQTIADVSKALGDDLFDINVAEYRKIKDNVKHTFTQEQFQELSDKYFKDVQSTTQEIKGLQTRNINGEKVAIYYVAADGEKDVVIPSDVTVMSAYFAVYDKTGNVKNLYIPSSVSKIVDDEGREMQTVDPEKQNPMRFELLLTPTPEENALGLFENITVEKGSKVLYTDGAVLRYAKDDGIVYVMDKAQSKIDFELMISALRFENEDLRYAKLFSGFKTAEINDEILQKYGDETAEVNLNDVFGVISRLDVDTLNINLTAAEGETPDEGKPSSHIQAVLERSRDITVNLNLQGFDSYESSIYIALDVDCKKNIKADVYVNGLTQFTELRVGEYAYEGKMDVTFHIDMLREIYQEFYFNKLVGSDDSHTHYVFDTKGESECVGFEIKEVLGSSELALKLSSDVKDGDELTVPEKYAGLVVTELYIDADLVSNKSLTLIISAIASKEQGIETGLRRIDIYSASSDFAKIDNVGFVISYDGDMDTLKAIIPNYDYFNDRSLRCTLNAGGKTEELKTGYEYSSYNPENWKYGITVVTLEDEQEIKYESDGAGTVLCDYEEGYAYFLSDEYGQAVQTELSGDSVTAYLYASNSGERYYLSKAQAGTKRFSVSGSNYDLTLDVTFYDEGTFHASYVLASGQINGRQLDKGEGELYRNSYLSYVYDEENEENNGSAKVRIAYELGQIKVTVDGADSYQFLKVRVGGNFVNCVAMQYDEGSRCYVTDASVFGMDFDSAYAYVLVGDRGSAMLHIDGDKAAIFGNLQDSSEFVLAKLPYGKTKLVKSGDNYNITLTVTCEKLVVTPSETGSYYYSGNLPSLELAGMVDRFKVQGITYDTLLIEQIYFDGIEGDNRCKLTYGVDANLNLCVEDFDYDVYRSLRFDDAILKFGGKTRQFRIVYNRTVYLDLSEFLESTDDVYFVSAYEGLKVRWTMLNFDVSGCAVLNFFYEEGAAKRDYEICRLPLGEHTFNVNGENYDLSIVLKLTENENEFDPQRVVLDTDIVGAYDGQQVTGKGYVDGGNIYYEKNGSFCDVQIEFVIECSDGNFAITGIRVVQEDK